MCGERGVAGVRGLGGSQAWWARWVRGHTLSAQGSSASADAWSYPPAPSAALKHRPCLYLFFSLLLFCYNKNFTEITFTAPYSVFAWFPWAHTVLHPSPLLLEHARHHLPKGHPLKLNMLQGSNVTSVNSKETVSISSHSPLSHSCTPSPSSASPSSVCTVACSERFM